MCGLEITKCTVEWTDRTAEFLHDLRLSWEQHWYMRIFSWIGTARMDGL